MVKCVLTQGENPVKVIYLTGGPKLDSCVSSTGSSGSSHFVLRLTPGVCARAPARARVLRCRPPPLRRSVTDPRDGRKVALKKMPNVFQNLVSCKRVFRELRMLCFFKHDNVRTRTPAPTPSPPPPHYRSNAPLLSPSGSLGSGHPAASSDRLLRGDVSFASSPFLARPPPRAPPVPLSPRPPLSPASCPTPPRCPPPPEPAAVWP